MRMTACAAYSARYLCYRTEGKTHRGNKSKPFTDPRHRSRVATSALSPRCHREAEPDDVLPGSGDGAEAELLLGSFHALVGAG